ncbi:hypothetical protein N0B40_17865 [Chryseobacterium oranimense]|uniref:hypothetical protein n=1 Tax=Chryseobacterium oranimense TaxID=421058 RepID=UPI0021B04510|nr:hypothetical protein [Chryseobacterium oranimense]UWX60252.1 hypothetical protein N0B40_17865 [Chryseobacterium oranimense]
MRKIQALLFILIFIKISSQGGATMDDNIGKYEKIIPPSPSSFAFANYGNLPANLFTGTPRINIPLLKFETQNIRVPINIDYTSAGVMVDQFETLVGQSWSFNTGGIITKTVFGADDDVTPINSPDNFTMMDQSTIDYFESLVYTSAYNMEYDEFNFNFLGNSGKFIINKNGSIVQTSPCDIKLERVYNNGTNYFKATDEKGIIYLFEAIEKTRYFKSACEKTVNGQPTTSLSDDAWYLTKIVHPSGDEVYFEYDDVQYNYTPSLSQQLKFDMGTQEYMCYPGDDDNTSSFLYPRTPHFIDCHSMQTHYIKVLKRISSNNVHNGEVIFTYNQSHVLFQQYKLLTGIEIKDRGTIPKTIEKIQLAYLNTSNRHFLKNVEYQNAGQKYQLEYNDAQSLPGRLSTSQDLWGYYNGADNGTYFVPKEASFFRVGADRNINTELSQKGILTKVIYPTGGNTMFEYEQNAYWGTKRTVSPYQTIEESLNYLTSGSVSQGASFYTYTKNFNSGNLDAAEPVDIGASIMFYDENICPPFYDPSLPEKSDLSVGISLFDVDDNTYIDIYQGAGSPIYESGKYMSLRVNSEPTAQTKALLKANHNYILKVTSPKCISVDFGVSTYSSVTVPADVLTGGLRLKRQIDNAGSNPIVKRYYYNTYSEKNKSSGDEPEAPYFFTSYEDRIYCPDDPNSSFPNCSYSSQSVGVYHSSPIFSLFDTSIHSNIFYEYVTESLGGDNAEKGRIEHQFRIDRNASYSSIYNGISLVGPGGGIISSGYSNTGWEHGNELETKYISGSGQTNKTIKRIFVKETRNNTKYHNFIFNQVFPIKCLLLVDTDLGNMNVGYYFKEAYRNLLGEEEITDFVNGNISLVTNTKYFYNNPSHYQLNRQKTTFPDGKISEAAYSYAHEKGNQLMIDKNMIGIPLETSTIQTIGNNTKTLSRTETIYPKNAAEITNNSSSLVLPLSVLSYDLQNTTSSSTEMTYDKYDDKGNLQQYTTKDGVSTTIIWGYNKTQPIAKIEGAKLSDITQSLIDNIVSASNNDAQTGTDASEQSLISALDLFRNNSALVAYQISTYTYDPLIGVRSITPPSGIRESYIYDSANRLQKVIDVNGKVLKEMKYNYKN